MDERTEIRDFLISRRGKVTPDQVGVRDQGGIRRVPGLRRGEVAGLAGVSVEYYTQLERGNVRGVSESVLNAVARALQLDEAERDHLFSLVRSIGTSTAVRRRPSASRVRPGIQAVLDGQSCPAWVSNGRGDVVAANHLGQALLSPLFDDPARPVNAARFRFLNPRAAEYYRDWDATGAEAVATLRAEAGANPYDRALTDLVGELSTRSEEFRTRWASHDVRAHRTGLKRLHHPVVGDLDLSYEALDLPADTGLRMFVFTTEPGSSSRHALDLLASWAAPQAAERTGAVPGS